MLEKVVLNRLREPVNRGLSVCDAIGIFQHVIQLQRAWAKSLYVVALKFNPKPKPKHACTQVYKQLYGKHPLELVSWMKTSSFSE